MLRLIVLTLAILAAASAKATANPQMYLAWRDCVRGSTLQYGCLSTLQYGGLSTLQYGGLSTLQYGGRSTLQYGGLSTLQYGGLSTLAGGGQANGRTRGFTAEQLRRMARDHNYIPRA